MISPELDLTEMSTAIQTVGDLVGRGKTAQPAIVIEPRISREFPDQYCVLRFRYSPINADAPLAPRKILGYVLTQYSTELGILGVQYFDNIKDLSNSLKKLNF